MTKPPFLVIWLLITLPLLYFLGVYQLHADESIAMCFARVLFIGIINGFACKAVEEALDWDG
jgi:hypothetical protein